MSLGKGEGLGEPQTAARHKNKVCECGDESSSRFTKACTMGCVTPNTLSAGEGGETLLFFF